MTAVIELHATCDGEELLGDAYPGDECEMSIALDPDVAVPDLDHAPDLGELYAGALAELHEHDRFKSGGTWEALPLATGATAHLCPNCSRHRSAIPRAQLQTEKDEP